MKALTTSLLMILIVFTACKDAKEPNEIVPEPKMKSAEEILSNPDYLAISYGGYRAKTRDEQPTVNQLKEDMKILSAMGIKILRTYNVQLPQASNIAKAIQELKKEDPEFEMYMMLGAWIDCKNAWTRARS